ncbi:hypothetical protein CLU79DRAFT_707041 [Phycomyces nitens]|nr:hypothetical protein CLU79DRAFT_707041 [Phycomyces nitens]
MRPFLLSLGLVPRPSNPSRFKLTTKKYRQLCSIPSADHPPNSINWSRFWLLPLFHPCRNIWYQYLHQKIPCKSLLHRFIPSSFPSAACPLCLDPVESLDHFLFSCPFKLPIWHHVWSTHVTHSQAPTTLPALKLALTSMLPPDSSSPKAMLAIAAALEAIWRTHWSFIFKDTPFNHNHVESLIDKLIRKAQQESFLSSNIPHAPPPFFSID